MEWLWQLPRTRAVLSVLSTIFLIQRQVLCLHIRPQQCHNSMGDYGTCMFVWECIKTEGKHLGTCADGFLFGSCCAHNDSKNNIIPSVEASTTETYQKSSSTSSVTKISTTSPSNVFSSKTTVPQSFHTTSSTQRRPPYFKPSTPVNHVITKPTPKPSTDSESFTINRPVHQSSSSRPEYLSSTDKPRTTTHKYGIVSNTQSWLHTSSFQSTHVPSKYPTNVPTTRQPTVSHWTQKYTYVRPSWKPSTFKPYTKSTLPPKPVVFTYTTNNYSFRPSFKPFTTKVPQESFSTSDYLSSVTSVMKLNFTIPIVKTTPSYPSEKPVTENSAISLINTTQKVPIFTTSHSISIPVTPNYPAFYPTVSKNTPTDGTTQSWFHPLKQKSTTVSPVSSYSTAEDNFLITNATMQEEYSTISPKYSSTPSVTTLKENNSSGATFKPAISVTTQTTTPLPVTPCGIPSPHPKKKVVGGKNSAFGSWPWQASVRRTSFFGFSSTHRCGGALISRQWVATAGHCVDDLLLSQIKIRVGEYDFASVQEPHGYVERGAKKKVVHPRYNFFTYENDLALVQLEEAIDPTKHPHISPICLPPSEENLVGKNATVTGWGRLSEGGVLPSILQEVQVPIISNEKCKNMFLAAGRHEYIPDIFMCAGFEEGGRDSCQGDSGGPLQIQADDGYWFLAGIISWGIGCAEPNMPGVCTRISKFKDWVVQQIT